MAPAMIGANTVGAGVVFVYLAVVAPRADDDGSRVLVNSIVFAAYLGAALLVGAVVTVVLLRRLLRWLRARHQPDAADRRLLLRLPARVVRLYAALWATAALVFGALNLPSGVADAFRIAQTIGLGGLTVCALSYLVAERLVRPLVAAALHGTTTPPPVVLGVRRRILLSWALGTGVPLTGIVIGVLDPSGDGRLGEGAVLFLAVSGLVVGLAAMVVTARSLSDPVVSVAAALRRVGQGDLDVAVEVYDVSEIGQLQSGFNAMVGGLRERDRLADLFGRQVGTEAARHSLERGVQLGGQRREVAVLFVDVVGSTTLAAEHEPEEVVTLLNAFFAVVVDVVHAHHGWVNKFEGDAALCIFGAPEARPDAAACALAAARALARGLEPLALDAAVGVSAGPVVAGHVGTETRFEYTVIGDPVNAAARLTELAKQTPGRVLADGDVVEGAGSEAQHWEVCGEAVLRGRTAPTRLARPA